MRPAIFDTLPPQAAVIPSPNPTFMQHAPTVLDPKMVRVFGSPEDPIEDVEWRARREFPYQSVIVWQRDPATFAFQYVGGDADALLGYSSGEWASSPTFWSDRVVHSEDRRDVVAYCALATARGADHVFEYRALTKDFNIVWLKDYVRVITGQRGFPIILRGLTFDISDEKWATDSFFRAASYRMPPVSDLSGSGSARK